MTPLKFKITRPDGTPFTFTPSPDCALSIVITEPCEPANFGVSPDAHTLQDNAKVFTATTAHMTPEELADYCK